MKAEIKINISVFGYFVILATLVLGTKKIIGPSDRSFQKFEVDLQDKGLNATYLSQKEILLKKAEVLIIIIQSHPPSFDGIGLTGSYLKFEIKESFLAATG